MGYVIMVKGHVLLMNHKGDVIVDTSPRKADRREVLEFYGVIPKHHGTGIVPMTYKR